VRRKKTPLNSLALRVEIAGKTLKPNTPIVNILPQKPYAPIYWALSRTEDPMSEHIGYRFEQRK
jgi:hypothetical protein